MKALKCFSRGSTRSQHACLAHGALWPVKLTCTSPTGSQAWHRRLQLVLGQTAAVTKRCAAFCCLDQQVTEPADMRVRGEWVCKRKLNMRGPALALGLETQTEEADLGRGISQLIPGRHRGRKSVAHVQGWLNTCHIPFRRKSVAGDSTVTREHMYSHICSNFWQAGMRLLSVITCENTDFRHQYFTRSTYTWLMLHGGAQGCHRWFLLTGRATKPWQMLQPVFRLSGCYLGRNGSRIHVDFPLRLTGTSHIMCVKSVTCCANGKSCSINTIFF